MPLQGRGGFASSSLVVPHTVVLCLVVPQMLSALFAQQWLHAWEYHVRRGGPMLCSALVIPSF